MPSGRPVVLDHARVIAKYNDGMTLTAIAKSEGCHRSCVGNLLKSLGYTIIPSRGTGPSKNYLQNHNPEARIARARKMIARGKAILASYGLDE